MDRAKQLLKQYYGYDTFKNGQEEALNAIIHKKDTFVIMPTGGGKSLCYQLPALMNEGITLVISPLISLMKDQVDALKENGIAATFINGTLDYSQIQERLQQIKEGLYKILYIAPERLEMMDMRLFLKQLTIPLIAIDEAHCISQWGHDFRPSYIRINEFVKSLESRPTILALTATATPQVQQDILTFLDLHHPSLVVTGYDRENLYFAVERDIHKENYIIQYVMNNKDDSGIIYCSTRKEVEKIRKLLLSKGIDAVQYHAGLSDDERNTSQEEFLFDRASVIVATNAFGMGIDKSNVRYVIHYNMPKSLEAYYQEAGRAGRDGLTSECILLYKPGDSRIHKYFIEESDLPYDQKVTQHKKLQGMVDYCHTSRCLREYILEYFGDNGQVHCDFCSQCKDERQEVDITLEGQKVFSCIYRMNQRYGATMIASVLAGSKNKKVQAFGLDTLKTYGIMQDKSIKEIQQLIYFFIADGYLHMTEEKYPIIKLKDEAIKVLKNQKKIYRKAELKIKKKSDNQLFDELRQLRKDIATELQIPPYIIFHDATLKEMSAYMPKTKEEMLQIKGLGEAKYDKYGDRFLQCIIHYVANQPHIYQERKIIQHSVSAKDNKIPSHEVTLAFFKKGLTINEIAKERNLTTLSIENHIFRCYEEGHDINVSQFIPEEFKDEIFHAIEQCGIEKLKPIKEILPEEVSYTAIKAAILVKYQNPTV